MIKDDDMTRMIQIIAGDLEISAEINDSPSANAIWEALPIKGAVNRWGEEIYFSIPVNVPISPQARDVMAIGELAYWTGGSAFCIFFGPTPVSQANEPRAYVPVNPFGMVRGDATRLTGILDGEQITIIKQQDLAV